MALVMLFSFAFFGANCESSNPCGHLCDEINAVSKQINYFQNSGNATLTNTNTLLENLAQLYIKVKNLQYENAALLARITDYEYQLIALRKTLGVGEWSYSKCGNFALNITVESNKTERWDFLLIYIEFKNLSEEEQSLAYFRWFPLFANMHSYIYPYSPSLVPLVISPSYSIDPLYLVIPSHNSWHTEIRARVRSEAELGKHRLQIFPYHTYVSWEGIDNEQNKQLQIVSNAISIRVY